MAEPTYAAIASLDGYVEDEEGKFDWAVPDDAAPRPRICVTGPAMRRQAKIRTGVNRC